MRATSLLILCLSAGAADLAAQTAPTMPANTMPLTEVLACIEREKQLTAQMTAQQALASQQHAEFDAIAEEAKQIAIAQQAVKSPNKAAVEQMTRRLDVHNQRVAANNAAAQRVNDAGAALRGDIDSFNAACAGRPIQQGGKGKLGADTAPPVAPLPDMKETVFGYDGGRYVFVRTTANDCVIALQGEINDGAETLFGDVVKHATSQGCNRPATLVLESLGGVVSDGIRLGRKVRTGGFRTLARYECASSCVPVFLGGIERTLWGARATIGLHQIRNVTGREELADGYCEKSRQDPAVSDMRKYFALTIPTTSEQVFEIMMATSCKSITWLSGQRAIDLGIATKIEASEVDLGPPKTR